MAKEDKGKLLVLFIVNTGMNAALPGVMSQSEPGVNPKNCWEWS